MKLNGKNPFGISLSVFIYTISSANALYDLRGLDSLAKILIAATFERHLAYLRKN